MANPTVGEVLEALRPSFQAIDLRAIVVALADSEGWRNAFTVIRFSTRTPREISAEHDKLKKLYGLPDDVFNKRLGEEHNIEPYKGIRIELSAHAAGQFGYLVGRMREGVMNASRRMAFRVFDPDIHIDLMREEMSLVMNWDYKDIGERWPVYYWGQGQQRTEFQGSLDMKPIRTLDFAGSSGREEYRQRDRPRLEGRDLDRQSREIGFTGFQELAEGITGSFFGRSGYGQNAFQIFAPVYARITSITPSSDVVEVTGSFHPALGELVVECSLDESAQWPQAGRPLGRVRVSPQSVEEGFAQFSSDFPLEEPPVVGTVRAFLFKQAASRVDLHKEQSPLKSGVLAFRAFACFVPEEDITEYLACLTSGTNIVTCRMFQKFTPKDGSKKNDELIEYVVAYLLGLCQLSPILLSNPKYDVIEGDLQAGSADIVASAQDGGPILVSITMAMPDKRKRDMLHVARTAIASRTGVPLEMIRLILVTGKPSVSPSDTELVELAATDLERLWGMCRQGNLAEARHLLGIQ